MRRVDERAFAQNRRPLQDVAKLSNIAGPVILEKGLSCVTRQTSRWPTEGPADLLQKHLAQRHDIDATLAEWRNSTPPDASSTCPGFACCALVNAPRS